MLPAAAATAAVLNGAKILLLLLLLCGSADVAAATAAAAAAAAAGSASTSSGPQVHPACARCGGDADGTWTRPRTRVKRRNPMPQLFLLTLLYLPIMIASACVRARGAVGLEARSGEWACCLGRLCDRFCSHHFLSLRHSCRHGIAHAHTHGRP
eukprot:364474-Chlamydomonas_euryale.AAC.1